MRQPKYSVALGEGEIAALRGIVDDPKTSKTRRAKAEILLDLDGKRATYSVVECLSSIYGMSIPSVYHLMERYGREGVDAVKKSPNSTPRRFYRMTTEVENAVLSWIKMPPPEGRRKWSAYLIADKIVEEGIAKKMSYQTIYRLLDKLGVKL